MWSPFGNGSSGFVSRAQGWEFVPGSRSERGGEKVQSPRVRSFPSNLLEPLASDPTSYNELQSQHTRLKKRFDEMKKRQDQERDAWRMEKEMLLRQFADIQGGENRRILLDLKVVLEEVQNELKLEERKRNELELSYIKDRCCWHLERTELMSRITQLEVNGGAVPSEAIRRTEQGDTLKREREEQKRLLADTHSAAMDLRCRLENSEKGWVKEKCELLERFDSERKEWENQLMDMQRKIEELYDEVKAQCKGGHIQPFTDIQNSALRISSCSASTLSSDAQSNEHSEVLTQQSNDSPIQPHYTSSESNDQCISDQNLQEAEKNKLGGQQAIDTAELEEILESCLKLKKEKNSGFIGRDDLLNPFKRFQSMEIKCGTDRKTNTDLNAALKEIARVSEELCSYQDDKGKWPDFKRSIGAMYYPGEDEMLEKVKDNLETEDTALDLKNLSEELKSLDEQYWINREGQTIQNDAKPLTSKGQCAPPIPARSTSWYLSSPSLLETSGTETLLDKEFQKPGVHQERKYNSPAIVRKFEAMLQENEGKVLMDSVNVTCTVPDDSNHNINFCKSRWSCDGNKFGSIKSSKCSPVKKCLSSIDIATAATDCSRNLDSEDKNYPKGASHPVMLNHMPTDSLKIMDIVLPYSYLTANHRNEQLDQKTAEFNRTLFQAGMGHPYDEENPLNVCTDGKFASTPSLTVRSKGTLGRFEDKIKDLMKKCTEDQFSEVDPNSRPRLKSETKDVGFGLTELPLDSSDHASKDLPSLKEVTNPSKEVKPLQTNNSQTMPVLQLDPCVGEKSFELIATPLQIKIQKEGFSKNIELGTDQPLKHLNQAKQDTRSRILEDNPWKPSTLAAYPRPVEARSNYGAIERILKSYENQDTQQPSQPSHGKKKDHMDLLKMLDTQHESRSSQRQIRTPHHQVIAHKEKHHGLSVTFKKSFSRPACPAKRRLPSRWARPSSTSSASTPSPPPTMPASTFTQQQTLTYSTYHTETVI